MGVGVMVMVRDSVGVRVMVMVMVRVRVSYASILSKTNDKACVLGTPEPKLCLFCIAHVFPVLQPSKRLTRDEIQIPIIVKIGENRLPPEIVATATAICWDFTVFDLGIVHAVNDTIRH